MKDEHGTKRITWYVDRSIILELDLSLPFLKNRNILAALSIDELELAKTITEDWLSDWNDLWEQSQYPHDLLEISAYLADAIRGDDYAQATRRIRELTPASAASRLNEQAACLGIPAAADPARPESISLLVEQIIAATYNLAKMPLEQADEHAQRMHRGASFALRIIKDGDLHTRFWQLLDRFYYEFYRPWRETRLPAMADRESQVRMVLGSTDELTRLDWLPARSPLLRLPELRSTVLAGDLEVVFWSEPFEVADSWSLWPGVLLVSFTDSGKIYESFQNTALEVAARASALGDPTRLIILRLIRNFGMFNTEIANFLGLSQPTVSVHARILREAGLIRSQQEGRLVRHKVNTAEVRRLFKDLERFLDLPEE